MKGQLAWLPEPMRLLLLKTLARKAQRELLTERTNLELFLRHHSTSRLMEQNVPEKRATEAVQLLHVAVTFYTSAHISLNRLLGTTDIHDAARHSTTSRHYAQKGAEAINEARETLSCFGVTV